MELINIRTTAKHDYYKLQQLKPKRNIIQQQFFTVRLNQIMVSDITYFAYNKNTIIFV